MHDDHHHHDHDHHHGHDHHGRDQRNGHRHPHPPGHNGPAGRAVQWQTPHLPQSAEPPTEDKAADLDLVEAAFVEGFLQASDVASFLRLSGIPFVGDAAGTRLHLLRVETDEMVDVGSVMPLVGGAGVTYHPLPAKLTSRRRRLSFIYHDGSRAMRLSFAEARALPDRSAASQFAISS
jgi:hypothetical protein